MGSYEIGSCQFSMTEKIATKRNAYKLTVGNNCNEEPIDMTQSLYSLRWNNHQNHIMSSFETLLQNESLVDVSLVCSSSKFSIRAHKVVLSACSPFFEKIFAETPCKHPVIVLKDFQKWEIQTIVDFMYRGEVSISQEQIQSLMKAAESLQIRGLANQECAVDKEASSNRTATPCDSPGEYEKVYMSTPRSGFPISARPPSETPQFSPISRFDSSVKLPHMSQIQFPDMLLPKRDDCPSPVPRRKQSRPRRRSGELSTPQDLTINPPKSTSPISEEMAENLCMKKQRMDDKQTDDSVKTSTPEPMASPELDLTVHSKDFNNQSPPLALQNVMKLNHDLENHNIAFPPMPSVSALAMSQPHNKFFGLDTPLLFPHGMDAVRNPLLEMADPRTTPESHLFAKKKSRPKGQHSAPRGGPPRSWTNAELTEALQQVWNKKMTTSQASRVYGIPYNSLLMYVRGKYGKSLKLEKLREGCTGGPQPLLDIIPNAQKQEREQEHVQPNPRPSSTEENQHPMFNPFAPSFYPDFGSSFPIPVSMIHLLPHSEKNSEAYRQQQSSAVENSSSSEVSERTVKEEPQDLFMSSALSRDERRELVQQNGQD